MCILVVPVSIRWSIYKRRRGLPATCFSKFRTQKNGVQLEVLMYISKFSGNPHFRAFEKRQKLFRLGRDERQIWRARYISALERRFAVLHSSDATDTGCFALNSNMAHRQLALMTSHAKFLFEQRLSQQIFTYVSGLPELCSRGCSRT